MVARMSHSRSFIDSVDFARVLIELRRLRWVIVGASIAGSIAGAAIAKSLVEPIFEARVILECDRCSRPDYGERELATLQETIKLPQHLEKVRQELQLNTTLENLDLHVDVGASLESRLIRVSARQKKGDMAAAVANGVVEAFLETRLQIERELVDERVRKLRKDAQNALTSVNEARTRYDAFRRDNNISDLSAERLAAIQEAARLRSELSLARGEEEAEKATVSALQKASSHEPSTAILEETEDLPNAKRLAETRAQLTAAQSRLSAEHPRVQALAAEVTMLEEKVALANDAFTTGRRIGRNPQWESAQQGILMANANQEAAKTRHLTYEKLARQAAQAAARLSDIEGRASELLSNVENAERHSTTISLDVKVAEDAARNPSTGLRILSSARVPSIPVASPRKAVAVLGPVVGALLASILIILYQFRGLRIHTAAELTYWGRGPTIASSHWPNSSQGLSDLVDDLSDSALVTKGRIAMVAMSVGEVPVVDALLQNIRVFGPEGPFLLDTFSPKSSTPALRRALKNSTHTLVVVSAGKHSALAVQNFVEKLNYAGRLGFILVNLDPEYASLADLAGNVAAFWRTRDNRREKQKKLAMTD